MYHNFTIADLINACPARDAAILNVSVSGGRTFVSWEFLAKNLEKKRFGAELNMFKINMAADTEYAKKNAIAWLHGKMELMIEGKDSSGEWVGP